MKLGRSYDFNKPQDARDFLEHLHFGDKKVEYIKTTSGKEIYFDHCSDEDACLAASLLYEEFICYQERLEQGLQS